MQSEKFDITGMTCAACQANITRKVSALDGVETVDVNLLANSMQVSYDETKTNTGAIIAAVTQIGYGASPAAAAARADACAQQRGSTRCPHAVCGNVCPRVAAPFGKIMCGK